MDKLSELKHDFYDPPMKPDQLEENINANGIFKLNFECLVHIVSFLGLEDMVNLDKVSDNFQPITEHATKFFDCKSICSFTLNEITTAFEQIGSYITSIKAHGSDLSEVSDDEFLELVFELCTNLEHICFDFIDISDQMIFRMSKLFPRLKSIELMSCGLDDYRIEEYFETATILEKLDLQGNSDISGSCISKINNLSSLNLSYCDNIDPYYFAEFCLNNTSLTQLNIIFCHNLTLQSINDITRNLINLEELSISNNYTNVTTSNDFFEILKLPKLKKLHLCFIQPGFRNLTKLEDLLFQLAKRDIQIELDISLTITPITETIIKSIIGLNKLEILNMTKGYFDLNDKMLSQLATKGTIKELHLNNSTTITTAGLTHFVEKSPMIRVLRITKCNQITDEFYYSVVRILKEQKRRHSLTVFAYGTQMNEREFYPAVIVENLPWIEVKFVKHFDDHDDVKNDDDHDDDDDLDIFRFHLESQRDFEEPSSEEDFDDFWDLRRCEFYPFCRGCDRCY